MNSIDSFEQRYEPTAYADLIFTDPNVRTRLLDYAKCARYRSILLHGPFGSAKSTTAEIIVKERHRCIGVSSSHIERFTGAQLRDNVEMLENALSIMITTNGGDTKPYVIIDEIDQLPKNDQLEVRRTIDTLSVAKFIFTTNDFSKVDGGLRDRSDCYYLGAPTAADMLPRAQTILAAEGVSASNKVLLSLLKNAGSVRGMLRELEALVLQLKSTPTPPTPPPVPPKLTVLTAANLPPS